jgi:glycosyltransferase involved in cell wall biosynthesis
MQAADASSGATPRFLFVPVSGPTGMGEYARCLALAHAVRGRWPGAAIHFLLSEQAPYARSTPYDYTLFAASPTLHDREGRAAIRAFRPDVVVFDNAGRKGQLAAAHALGAGVVYVSSRWRPRTKAFRLRWLPYLDEHWIPYPEFVGGALTRFERLKQSLFGRPRVRFLDVMLPPVEADAAAAVLARYGLAAGRYALVVPGGGTAHPNASANAQRAPAIYEAVAARLAAAGHAVAVAGRDAPAAESNADPAAASTAASATAVRWCGRLPPHELAALLGAARVVVTNGGDTLLQALACGRPTVAAPIAADQPARLQKCAARGGVVAVPLDEQSLADAALGVLADGARRERLAAEARAHGYTSGIATALDAFGALLARR